MRIALSTILTSVVFWFLAGFSPIWSETANHAGAIVSPTSTNVAVVNVSVLLSESPLARALQEDIKSKYLPQEQALTQERDSLNKLEEALDKESEEQSSSERIKKSRAFRERKREYTRNYEAFRDQLNTARQDALSTVRQDVLEAIGTVRRAKNIDIVFETYISASQDVDITPAVIEYLKNKYQGSTANSATNSTNSADTTAAPEK